MKTFFKLKILLIFLCSSMNSFSLFSQECGTESPNRQDAVDFVNFIENAAFGITANTFEQEYLIPVHLHIINDDNGNPLSGNIEANFIQGLNTANSYFTNGMQYILCGVSEIDNTEHLNISTQTEALAISSTYNIPGVLNIYYTGEVFGVTGGAASFPWLDWNAVILATTSSITITHELGHYFGLLHTHQGGISITPQNEWNTEVFPNNCWCCDCGDNDPTSDDCYSCGITTCDCNADNSGDMIDDTNPDPRAINGTNPTGTCEGPYYYYGEFPNNDETIIYEATYMPDYKNIMSYYNCREHFSDKQSERMKMTLLTYPTRIDLINNDEITCDVFPSTLSKVEKVSLEIDPVNSIPQLLYYPFGQNKVTIKENDAANICVKTTGLTTGIYFIQSCNIMSGDINLEVFPQGKPIGTNINDQVDILDLLTLQRHILTIQPLVNSFQYLAADVDYSGSLTVLDLIDIRRIILGTSSQFLGVPSWRYVPDYAISDPNFSTDFEDNPFTATWNHPNGSNYGYFETETNKSYLNRVELNMLNPDVFFTQTWAFKGIKSGNVLLEEETEEDENLNEGLSVEYLLDSTIPINQEFYINVTADGYQSVIDGYQLGLSYDQSVIEILGFEKGDLNDFTPENFSITEGEGEFSSLKSLWINRGIESLESNFILSPNKTTLFKIIARSKKTIDALDEILYLSDESLKSKFVDNSLSTHLGTNIGLEINLSDLPKKHILLNIFPNPAINQVQFRLSSSEQVEYSLMVQDQFGQSFIFEGQTSLGEQNLMIDNISLLANGPIYYRINIGTEFISGYFIKQ